MSKHTTWRWDGNWLVHETAQPRGSDLVLYYTTADDGLHGSESDKALVVAAPEMLEALRKAADQIAFSLARLAELRGVPAAELSNYVEENTTLITVRAAIAKAEGRK